MKKTFFFLIVVNALIMTSVLASVTLSMGFGTMYASTDTSITIPSGARINILAAEGNGSGTWSSFGDLITLFSGQTEDWAPTGTRLIASFGNNESGGPGMPDSTVIYSYSGNFAVGDQLLMVVYPTLTMSSLQPGLSTSGFFFRTDSIIDYSDIAWAAPADGGTFSLFAYTIDTGVGSLANNTFTSGAGAQGGNGFTTVPEPATYALLAMGAVAMGGYMMRRRQRG